MRAGNAASLRSFRPSHNCRIKALIADLDSRMATIEADIAGLLGTIADLARQRGAPRSAPGIGPVTALTLIAHMPELGHTSPKAIASLAGLAPFDNDPGSRRGRRTVRGGGPRQKGSLHGCSRRQPRQHSLQRLLVAIAQRSGSKEPPSSQPPESSSPS